MKTQDDFRETDEQASKDDVGRQEIKPYQKLLFGIEGFISDLECTHEMFQVVTPILQERDKARSDEISGVLANLKRDVKAFTRGVKKSHANEAMSRRRR
jgi:hypothetical protein